MGSLVFMMLWSVACGGYAMALLKTAKSKFTRFCLWGSMISNGLAVLIISAAIAGVIHG